MKGRPIIGRDYYGRQRCARTLEEAFGVRGGLHAGRQRRTLDADWLIGAAVMCAIAAALLTGMLL